MRWKKNSGVKNMVSCHECKNRDYQHNMTTLIYNGISDKVLRDEYDKVGRKERTVENMVSMVVSRELFKENSMAYANTNNTCHSCNEIIS